jgi:hypothetical protein
LATIRKTWSSPRSTPASSRQYKVVLSKAEQR